MPNCMLQLCCRARAHVGAFGLFVVVIAAMVMPVPTSAHHRPAHCRAGHAEVECPAPSPTTTATPAPNPSAPTLTQVDGGPSYYAQFSNPLSSSEFPIGVWGAYNFTTENVAKDKAVGLNLYVWNADVSAGGQQNITNAGLRTLQNRSDGTTNYGARTAGVMLADEYDMSMTPTQGLSAMQAAEDQGRVLANGRALYTNYGKGVLFGWANGQRLTNAQREQYINAFQELQSSDLYWYTDPWQSTTGLSSDDTWLPEGAARATSISGNQVRRASNYGYQIDKMRSLDAADGRRKPIWAFVEVGSPFGAGQGDGLVRRITPEQIRAAVWHSIIAGARGIIYFQHSFSGSCPTHHVLRGDTSCYAATISMVTSVNAQIKSLAPVLNAASVTSGTSTSSGVRALYKWHDGHFYVIAGNRDHTAKSGTMGLPCIGSGATAVNLGETVGSLTIPLSGGQFTAQFAADTGVHVYRIDGGSTCGL
jgi:hypothetical protein